MGIRTELRIDGDECTSCHLLLAEHGKIISTERRIQDDMKITVVNVLCLKCFTVTDIAYWAELLPSERMKSMLRSCAPPQSNTARVPERKGRSREKISTHQTAPPSQLRTDTFS